MVRRIHQCNCRITSHKHISPLTNAEGGVGRKHIALVAETGVAAGVVAAGAVHAHSPVLSTLVNV